MNLKWLVWGLWSFSFRYMSCVVGFEETSHCNFVFKRSRVCRSYKHHMSSRLDAKNDKRPVAEPTKTNNHFPRQQFAHCIIKKSHVSRENQTHRHKVLFHKRIGEQQRDLFRILWVWRPACRHIYKTIGKGYVLVSAKLFRNDKFYSVNYVIHRESFNSQTFCKIFVLKNTHMVIIKGECWK